MSNHEFESNQMGRNFRNKTVDVGSDVVEAPPPGSESVGPSMFDLVMETKRASQVNAALIKEASTLFIRRRHIDNLQGQTDGSGNLDLLLYRCQQGMEFVVNRVNVEGGVFTPAVPFTAATAWIALIAGDKFALGNILDFLPNPPVASGPIIPAIFTDGVDDASLVRGGQILSLHIANGPVNTLITARLQGTLRAV